MARRRLGFWKRLVAGIVRPAMILLTRRDWRGMENIPKTGPVIVVANHVSHADPLALAHYIYDAGRWPGFLIKSGVFRIPVLGKILSWVDQTPVERGSVDAGKALDAAMSALREGNCVVVYPEGTTTREPDLWPMRGKTGVARLWLATGAPVVPAVTWGAQRLFDTRTRKLRLVPNTPVCVVAGPALDLSKWAGVAPTAPNLAEITDHIMLELRDLLAPLRDGTPPPLWSPKQARSAQPEPDSGAEG